MLHGNLLALMSEGEETAALLLLCPLNIPRLTYTSPMLVAMPSNTFKSNEIGSY